MAMFYLLDRLHVRGGLELVEADLALEGLSDGEPLLQAGGVDEGRTARAVAGRDARLVLLPEPADPARVSVTPPRGGRALNHQRFHYDFPFLFEIPTRKTGKNSHQGTKTRN